MKGYVDSRFTLVQEKFGIEKGIIVICFNKSEISPIGFINGELGRYVKPIQCLFFD